MPKLVDAPIDTLRERLATITRDGPEPVLRAFAALYEAIDTAGGARRAPVADDLTSLPPSLQPLSSVALAEALERAGEEVQRGKVVPWEAVEEEARARFG